MLPAVTARDIPERPVACPEKGPRTEYMRAADVRIDYNVIAMMNASCAEQKTALQKLFVVPNASQRRLVVTSCNGARAPRMTPYGR